MHSLRERSERDMNTFNSELKDLQRIIDHDKKLREFMRTKMEERTEIYELAVNGRKEKKLLNYVKALQVELEHYESIFNELVEVGLHYFCLVVSTIKHQKIITLSEPELPPSLLTLKSLFNHFLNIYVSCIFLGQ